MDGWPSLDRPHAASIRHINAAYVVYGTDCSRQVSEPRTLSHDSALRQQISAICFLVHLPSSIHSHSHYCCAHSIAFCNRLQRPRNLSQIQQQRVPCRLLPSLTRTRVLVVLRQPPDLSVPSHGRQTRKRHRQVLTLLTPLCLLFARLLLSSVDLFGW